MPKIWPTEVIRELLALAAATGESQATLASAEEARLFRFAIYTFRKVHGTGADLSITLDDNIVVVRKRTVPVITLSSEADTTVGSEQ